MDYGSLYENMVCIELMRRGYEYMLESSIRKKLILSLKKKVNEFIFK